MEEIAEKQLDSLLRQHPIEPASNDLAARIIAGAKPRMQRLTPWQALAELLQPAPVAAFACSLLLGILAGQQLPSTAAPTQQSVAVPKISQNAGAFLYYNGEIL